MSFKIREAHWELMISFMEENKDFAVGRVSALQSRETFKKMWQKLATELNSLGFGEKSAEKWQKTWTDFKYSIKKKASQIKNEQIRTGGGPPTTQSLNTFEQRALNVLGGKSFYEGLGCEEVGVTTKAKCHVDEVNEIASVEMPPISCNTQKRRDHDYCAQPSQKRKKNIQPVEEAYQETIIILKDIKNSLSTKLNEIKEVLDCRLRDINEALRDKNS